MIQRKVIILLLIQVCFHLSSCDIATEETLNKEKTELEFLSNDKICSDHARWIFQNKYAGAWKDYNLQTGNDCRRWLSCYEPGTCSLFADSRCDEFYSKDSEDWKDTGRKYNLVEKYEGNDFMNGFQVVSGNDPTHGVINYITKETALSKNLITFPQKNGITQFRTDIGSEIIRTANGLGRESVKIVSNKKYNGGLFVLDAEHFPEGKAVWPAFWLTGGDWPCNGEIDIVEYVNSFDPQSSINHSTLHTGQACVQDRVPGISNGGTCGASRGARACVPCGFNRSTQDCAYAGCGISQGFSTGGYAANRMNGAVYATEWVKDGEIKVWYFAQQDAEKYIPNSASEIDTTNWPKPYAKFRPCPGSFKDLEITINTTLCGEWAGPDFGRKGLGDCGNYVANPRSSFAEAYWLINSLRVFN